MEVLTPDVATAFSMMRWAEQGYLPLGGGVLDQCAIFLEAVKFVKAEEARIEYAKAERGRASRCDW